MDSTIWPTYRVFLRTKKAVRTTPVVSMLKMEPDSFAISSSLESKSCGLPSHRSQRGRQVKFLSKKSSLQVSSVVFNTENAVDPNIDEESIYKGNTQGHIHQHCHSNQDTRLPLCYHCVFTALH